MSMTTLTGTSRPLKIGLISFAHTHAASYVSLLQNTPGVELLTTDPDHVDRPGESGGAEYAASFGAEYVDTVQELLDWGPDGVVIASENTRHRGYTEQAAAAGAAVLCEKPLATSVADAKAMNQACQDAGVPLMVAYPVRFSPAFEALKQRVQDGAMGSLCAVTGTNNGKLPAGRAWFTDPALAGGGAMTDHTVHIADLMDALLDGTPARSVYARSNKILHTERAGGGPENAETAGLVSIEYENDLIVTIDCSWSKPDDYPTWGGLTLQLVGSEAVADFDAFSHRVEGFSQAEGAPMWLPYGSNLDAQMVSEFLDAVAAGRQPSPDGAVGTRTVAIVEAAYASERAGKPVAVQL